MKKISIIFAVLAVFMLLASCSNAAGEVDLAGNPVNLTGTWSGTIAYKQDADPDLPMSCVVGGSPNGYTDYAGTYVFDEANQTPYADWDQISINDGTTYTYKHLYYVNTITTKTTTVVNSDGSMVVTEVETETQPARDFQSAPTNVYYYIHYTNGTSPSYTTIAPAQTAGTATTTTTKTYSAPVKNLAGKYDYTVTTKKDSVETGALIDGAASTSSTVIAHETRTDFQSLLKSLVDIKDRTVAPTLVPVVWQNDITETITLEVTNDGLYTLTNVMTETQTAAAAAAATETNYAAAERKAGTKTTTTTTTGTIAAWEKPATDTLRASTTMALSSGVETKSVDKTNFFVDGYSDIPTIAKFAAAKEYDIRFLEGKAGRKETAKTRMYVNVSDKLDPNGCIAIFDKAVETEEE